MKNEKTTVLVIAVTPARLHLILVASLYTSNTVPSTVKLVSRRNSEKNNTQLILSITVMYDISISSLSSLIQVLFCTGGLYGRVSD